MIEYRVGNILAQPDLTHIVHQCNLYHTFGSGLAKAIKEKYPLAYHADLGTKKGDKTRLGTWTISQHSEGIPTIINLYSQTGLSSTDRVTSYDAMEKGLRDIESKLEVLNQFRPVKLGIPHKIGCGLGNGSWEIVHAVVKDVFEKSKVCAVICQLPTL